MTRSTPAGAPGGIPLTAAALQERMLRSPVNAALGLRVERVTPGELRLTATATEEWVNANGAVVHGGLIATMLDAATANSVIAITGELAPTVTLDLHYVRPVRPGPLRAVGRPVRIGRSVSVVDGELWAGDVDLDGDRGDAEPLALARGTFAMLAGS